MMRSIENKPQALATLARSEGWSEAETQVRLGEFREFTERLAKVSRGARKLLTLVAEQAPTEIEHEALMPRLHESCGLDPEEMDRFLHELSAATLVRIDGQYPFEQIALVVEPSGWTPMDALARLAKAKSVNLRQALGDLDWTFLEA
jgi:hypothetical protein